MDPEAENVARRSSVDHVKSSNQQVNVAQSQQRKSLAREHGSPDEIYGSNRHSGQWDKRIQRNAQDDERKFLAYGKSARESSVNQNMDLARACFGKELRLVCLLSKRSNHSLVIWLQYYNVVCVRGCMQCVTRSPARTTQQNTLDRSVVS